MNNSVFPKEEEAKILQIIPLPEDATVVTQCEADKKSDYYPYLFDIRHIGGVGFMALCEYKGDRYVAVRVCDCWGELSDAFVVPTVYCPACKTRMFAHARDCTDFQHALSREPDQNGHLVYRCPTCGAEHVWQNPFLHSFDIKAFVDKDLEEREEIGWTNPPMKIGG